MTVLIDNGLCFSTHPDIKSGEDLLGFSTSTTTTTTTTASPEEGSGEDPGDGWNLVYEAIVWIDAFTGTFKGLLV